MLFRSNSFESYQLKFLSEDFFILQRYGVIHKEGDTKYIVMGREARVRYMEWRECMDLLYNTYRYNMVYLAFASTVIGFVLLVLYFSV